MDAYKKIHQVYHQLEPNGGDAWNPLYVKEELGHRLYLYQQLCRALTFVERPINKLKILDVGCGVGRSARLLVELGAQAQNITAIDVRNQALKTAAKQNPAIKYRLVDGLKKWPSANFDLIILTTVFSSLPGKNNRHDLAQKIISKLAPQGFVFWWDRIKANSFAGRDRLRAPDYFSQLTLRYHARCSLVWPLDGQISLLNWPSHFVQFLFPTHTTALLQLRTSK